MKELQIKLRMTLMELTREQDLRVELRPEIVKDAEAEQNKIIEQLFKARGGQNEWRN